jgi:hypothetical protein
MDSRSFFAKRLALNRLQHKKEIRSPRERSDTFMTGKLTYATTIWKHCFALALDRTE